MIDTWFCLSVSPSLSLSILKLFSEHFFVVASNGISVLLGCLLHFSLRLFQLKSAHCVLIFSPQSLYSFRKHSNKTYIFFFICLFLFFSSLWSRIGNQNKWRVCDRMKWNKSDRSGFAWCLCWLCYSPPLLFLHHHLICLCISNGRQWIWSTVTCRWNNEPHESQISQWNDEIGIVNV